MYKDSVPYKGLLPYCEQDAEFFFGREMLIRIIKDNLGASRLTLLYGASGVGKTSILQAGVAYQVNRSAADNLKKNGSLRYAAIVFNSWRDDPIDGIIQKVKNLVLNLLNRKDEDLAFSSVFIEALMGWTSYIDKEYGIGEIFIILDQFEEYFLYHANEDGNGTFAVEFPRAVACPNLRVNFLLSLREDSLAKLDFFKGRIPDLMRNRLQIEHLDEQAAREAILMPIKVHNLQQAAGTTPIQIESKLVEEVLKQVQVGNVSITENERNISKYEFNKTNRIGIEAPYLQLVMKRLWQEEINNHSSCLKLETLEKLGGSKKIVENHLASIMERLRAEHKDNDAAEKELDIAAKIFKYLVTPTGTKIAHNVDDLVRYINEERRSTKEVNPRQVKSLLRKLSKNDSDIIRQVSSFPGDPESKERYEIFHDVLTSAVIDWRRQREQVRRFYTLLEEQEVVKQEIWKYIEEILDEKGEKVSDNTRFEMRRELNFYHIKRLFYPSKKGVAEVKKMLYKLGIYKKDDSEKLKDFNNTISPQLIAAVVRFQKAEKLKLIDGIVGDETLERIREKASRLGT